VKQEDVGAVTATNGANITADTAKSKAQSSAAEFTARFTWFKNRTDTEKRDFSATLARMMDVIGSTTAPTGDDLPLVKLARFGDHRDRRALRNDHNILHFTGVEGDYDLGVIPFQEAVFRLRVAGLLSLLYTTRSHAPENPRWRVLCPARGELTPDDRLRGLGVLNGILGGVLAPESETLSQSYYYGVARGSPAPMVEIVEGAPIDEFDVSKVRAIPVKVKVARGASRVVMPRYDEGSIMTHDGDGWGEDEGAGMRNVGPGEVARGHPDDYWGRISRRLIAGNELGRHPPLLALAGKLFSIRALDPELAACLVHAYNKCNLDPPFDDDHVDSVIRHAFDREMGR
jgi:hypothetical protein